MHFHSVSKLHVYDVKLKGKMESICQCITLLHVLHLKSDTLTEILQSHYTHFTLKSLQCISIGIGIDKTQDKSQYQNWYRKIWYRRLPRYRHILAEVEHSWGSGL